jgi:hypothetical protein
MSVDRLNAAASCHSDHFSISLSDKHARDENIIAPRCMTEHWPWATKNADVDVPSDYYVFNNFGQLPKSSSTIP